MCFSAEILESNPALLFRIKQQVHCFCGGLRHLGGAMLMPIAQPRQAATSLHARLDRSRLALHFRISAQ